VLTWARQPARDLVVVGARASDREAAREAIARLRFSLGLDDDLRAFHERFRWDPLLGPALRRNPYVRARRRPRPFEALVWAVTEQLIEFGRAVAIQRRLLDGLGTRCPRTGLRDAPGAATVAGVAPARLESFGLTATRAMALVRAAREVAAGRVDLDSPDHESAWRRLRAIPGIGRWTIEMLALTGQGRLDQVPAGDLGYLKLVGRLNTGRPFGRASEDEVRELLAGYDPWAGMAGAYLWASAGRLTGPWARAA
jgi:3-methyladenine DNA glycosylase/8-oxoguanine DNA glycosylase